MIHRLSFARLILALLLFLFYSFAMAQADIAAIVGKMNLIE